MLLLQAGTRGRCASATCVDLLQLNDQSQILANAQLIGTRRQSIRIAAAGYSFARRQVVISTNAQGSAVGGELRLEGTLSSNSLSSGSQNCTASTAGSGGAGSLNIHANDAYPPQWTAILAL